MLTFLICQIHTMYRQSGASIAKAQAEFTTNVLSNEGVRNAAANAAASGVRSQFGSGTQVENSTLPNLIELKKYTSVPN